MARGKQRKPKEIGFVSDLHAGSIWGMQGPRSPYGKQNVGQVYTWNCWCQMAEECPQLDLLVLNADLIDGKQRKSAGTGIVTASMGEQVEIAAECIQVLVDKCKPRKIVRTVGSGYHVGFDNAVGALDMRFGIKTVDIVLELELADGIVLNVKHAPEGSAGLYVGTGLDREALWAALTESRQGLPKADWIIRSHIHMYACMDAYGKTIATTPCWQLQSAFAQTRKFYRWQPDLGALRLTYDPMHDHRYHLVKRTFPLPERRVLQYGNL